MKNPFFILVFVGGLSAGCGGTDTNGGSGGTTGGGAGTDGSGGVVFGSGGTTGAGGGSAGVGGLNPGGGAGGAGGEEPCTSQGSRAEQIPLDMFIMMDRSGSMIGLGSNNGNIWAPIGTALGNFVALPEAAGLGVGIQFFPLQDDSCDVNLYAAPAAPIALLPGNFQAIQEAILNNHPDEGRTPTLPAIRGAIQHARDWAQQTNHKVIVVLATDGEPNECNSNVDAVAQVAAEGLNGMPSIETYVIGIGNIAGLNQIAQAGGTDQALIVPADPNVASQQFLDAMNAIRGSAQIPCDLRIPDPPAGENLDYEKVNVTFTVAGASSDIYFVDDPAQCDPQNGGWHYDNPASPNSIVLCPATCTVVETQLDAQIDIGLGCKTKRIFQ